MQITIHRDGTNYGPYTLEQVKEHVATGAFLSTDLASTETTPDWTPLSTIVSKNGSAPPPIPKLPTPSAAEQELGVSPRRISITKASLALENKALNEDPSVPPPPPPDLHDPYRARNNHVFGPASASQRAEARLAKEQAHLTEDDSGPGVPESIDVPDFPDDLDEDQENQHQSHEVESLNKSSTEHVWGLPDSGIDGFPLPDNFENFIGQDHIRNLLRKLAHVSR